MAGPVVIDANIAIALAFDTPLSAKADALMEAWQRARAPLYAPLLWEYEVATVLRKAVAAGILASDEATFALERCWRLGIVSITPSADLHREALRWAERLGQRAAYDAQYLALAERLGAELYTADRRLAANSAALGVDWVRGVTPEP